MKPIIEVTGLSKQYKKGIEKQEYLSLRDQMFKVFSRQRKKTHFWALRDLNFNVYPGESLAIIGKNGAGKSTLLKIMSKITPPTKGQITLRGRLSSLLEVGTGFHPELTGRENIFLNGSILGLSRNEIKREFLNIVEFSGVEGFIDTALKHYSSGMKLRLAFSVSAFLEPEILVIDEVLAVGDSAFQQKCIDKMSEVSSSGRTLIFVSHNLQAVKNLCNKAILLKQGRIVKESNVDDTIQTYLSDSLNIGKKISLESINERRGKQNIIFSSLSFSKPSYSPGDDVEIDIKLKTVINGSYNELDFGIAVQDTYKNNIFHFSNKFINKSCSHESDDSIYSFSFQNNLKTGRYYIVLFLRTNDEIQDWINEAACLDINEGNVYSYNNSDSILGVVQPYFDFSIK